MRTISQTLKDALADQAGDIIFRVNTWADQATYDASPTVPDYVWEVLEFEIFSTSANAKLATANDYTVSAFTVFTIERGLLIDGVEHMVESGLFFVTYYREDYGTIQIKGSSYPNIKIYIADGDGTYQEVIEAFCAEIGKTAVFKNPADAWLGYQFFEDDGIVRNNKAERFETLIRQKYTILVYEESPESLVFYNQDSFIQRDLLGVCWSPELEIFCGVGSTGYAYTSPDGITWTLHTAPAGGNSVCWSPDLSLFVAVGPNRVMTSPDGITWTARTSASITTWMTVCWSPERSLFVVVGIVGGFSAPVMTSPDGITWTARTAPSTFTYSVCWSPSLNLFCAVGLGGVVMTSPDGITWTVRTPAEVNAWLSVCWSPDLSLFVAVAGTGTHRVMTSPDGITWTARSAAAAVWWFSVCWSPEQSLFVAVSWNSDDVQTSPDGINWTLRTAFDENVWQAICWSPDLSLFVAVSSTGTYRVMTSPDGIAWTARTNFTDFTLTYLDGPESYIIRSQSEMHFIWTDELGAPHTSGDISTPQWNLGYLESTDDPPTTNQDPYYKSFLKKSPVRLDITDGDKMHFIPNWSIDPTKTIDAMVQVSEHFHPNETPTWYQLIKPIILFDKGEAG